MNAFKMAFCWFVESSPSGVRERQGFVAAGQCLWVRRACWRAVLGSAVVFLVAGCSGYYPVSVGRADQLTGVWSEWSGASVEFEDDGTFTATGLDESDVVGWGCTGFAERQRGAWSPSGTYGEVTFDGADCDDMQLAFYGSPTSFVACFTRDVTSGGCTHEFRRDEDASGGPTRRSS
ncbi:hypothetical protein ACFQ71_00545 [Streptomyces sp. NPDC056534]|uniref:hypothetical protein n=1 Tax=Streptomyces sp. NPDC056534 TaxID=3345857 RepID=UPI00369C5741